jgi:type IV pilus assembly protein PilA
MPTKRMPCLLLHDRRAEAQGFTVIELIAIVLILAVLASIAIPVFLNQRERGWRTTLTSDLRNAAFSMEAGAAELGSYPDDSLAILRTSPDVSVKVIEPPPAGMRYCVSATHLNLPGEAWMLDSSEGAVRAGDCS